jgi:ribose transport system substrate-binding protein
MRRSFVWIGALALALVLAAGASSSNSADPGVAKAKALYASLLKPSATIGSYKPLSKTPPKGKKIYFLQCSQPVCTAFYTGLKPAVAALGWTVTGHPFTQTPEGIQTAVQAAIDAKPDGIFFTGISPTLLTKQLAAAKAAKIPIVAGFDIASPSGPIIQMLGGSKTVAAAANSVADYVVADSGGKAKILAFSISAYTILNLNTSAFGKEVKRLCPGCSIRVDNVQVTDVGTKIPATVVSELQRDPSITYLAFAFGDMPLGVNAALKAAGLDKKVKIVSYGSASPTVIHDISTGKMAASDAWSILFNSWQAVDAFARYFVGDPVPAAPSEQPMLITSANAKSQFKGDANWEFGGPPNYTAAFKKLWHVS